MIQAIGKNLILQPVSIEEKVGVIITLNQEKPLLYKVISVGSEVLEIEPSDEVFVYRHGMHEIEFEGHKLTIVSKDNIFAKKRK